MVLKCYYNNPSVAEMPTWIRTIVLGWLAKIVRVKVSPGLINVMKKHVKEQEEVREEIEYERRNSILPQPIALHERSYTSLGDFQSRLRTTSLSYNGRNRSRTLPSERESSFEGEGFSTAGLSKLFNMFASSLQSIDEGQANAHAAPPTSPSIPPSFEATMKEMLLKQDSLLNNVRRLVHVTRKQEKNDIKKEEWKIVASIIDACFFWVFMAALIISTLVIFLQAPRY